MECKKHAEECCDCCAEATRLLDACIRMSHEIEQILGKALGYPGEADGLVCVGEHVAESIAEAAAERIKELLGQRCFCKEKNL